MNTLTPTLEQFDGHPDRWWKLTRPSAEPDDPATRDRPVYRRVETDGTRVWVSSVEQDVQLCTYESLAAEYVGCVWTPTDVRVALDSMFELMPASGLPTPPPPMVAPHLAWFRAEAELGAQGLRAGTPVGAFMQSPDAVLRLLDYIEHLQACVVYQERRVDAARLSLNVIQHGAAMACQELSRVKYEIAAVQIDEQMLRDERDQMQGEFVALQIKSEAALRACREDLDREIILCPECGKKHVDGESGDASELDPHREHTCRFCKHRWDHGRWSYGAHEPSDALLRERKAIQAIARSMAAEMRANGAAVERYGDDESVVEGRLRGTAALAADEFVDLIEARSTAAREAPREAFLDRLLAHYAKVRASS